MFNLTYAKFSPLASTAASQHGVLTCEQLERHGLSVEQIRYRVLTGQLVRQAGRVFLVAGSTRTWKQRLAAAALAAAVHTRVEGGAEESHVGGASHLAAAKLYGFRSVDSDIAVSIRYPRKLKVPGAKVVRSRDLLADDVTWVDGIPTTTPARTICDLGLQLPEHEVMRILRHAISIGMLNQREVVDLRWRISMHGRNGAGIIGRCLDDLPMGAEDTESGLEVLFLEVCERFNLPRPVLQLPVFVNGRTYRLDFAYPAQRVFIEIDGRGHSEPTQISNDGGRQNDLVAHGWQPVRFGYTQLRSDPRYCASVVEQLLGICDPEV